MSVQAERCYDSDLERKLLEQYLPVETYNLELHTRLHNRGSALNSKKNILFIFGYKSTPDWHGFMYTIEGYFVTNFAITTTTATHGILPFNSGYFTDNQIIVPLSKQELLFFSDYGITSKKFPKMNCFAYRNGEVYLGDKISNLIKVFSLNTGRLCDFRKFPLLLYSTIVSLVINGDQMAVLTSCTYFRGRDNLPNYTVHKVCLITENILQTLEFPNKSTETLIPDHCYFDTRGILLIHFSVRSSYSHCVWLPDGSSKLHKVEANKRISYSEFIGIFIIDNFVLINVYSYT